jgi:parallel beta-helix repeat protein
MAEPKQPTINLISLDEESKLSDDLKDEKEREDEDEFDKEIKELNEKKKKEEEEEEEDDELKEEKDFENEYIVGPNTEYKTIQSAVNACKNKSIIKISPGIYRENITVRNKNEIEICSLVADDPAILLSENSPCIMIHCLEANDTVKIYNIKFIHRGIRDDVTDEDLLQTEFFAWHISHINNKESYFIYKNAEEVEKLEVNNVLDIKIIENIFEDNHGNFCAISILKGTISVNNCQISLACLTTETKNVLPAIYIENSIAIIENTTIKGNKDYLTVGIYSHDAQLKINECRVFRHRCGGIVSVVNERNSVNISKCHVLLNEGCGILIMSLVGKSALKEKAAGVKNTLEINLEQNVLELNQGTGLILTKCFNASVIGNKFFSNILNGATLTDCDGFVMMNNFIKNKGTGLVLEAIEESNEAKIFKNFFDENYKNGIDIRGKNNNSIISQNSKIANNYLNGIYVHNEASPEIKYNDIFENNHHGILIESNSYAEVSSNKIFGNIKTNVAFGGKLSSKVKITSNEIYNSRNEGIYIVEADGGEVARNKVYDNNEGIVLINCVGTLIHHNEIYHNMRTGVLVSDESICTFLKNELVENYFIGLLIRDSSTGSYRGNLMRQNVIQFYVSKECLKLKDSIVRHNNVEGRFETADYCNIF